jgi:TolB protein
VEGQDDIFVMDRNGGGITNLTSHQAGDASPTWSPDGKRVAFISTRNSARGDLFVLDLESRTVHQVTSGGVSYSQPAWSPAGDEIAFTHIATNGMGISAIRPDGTGLRRLTATVTGYPDYFPAWRRRGGE